MNFTELANSLKETLFPIYLVEGEEAYFRDHAVKSIRQACKIALTVLNDVREEGETIKSDRLFTFRDSLYALPFLDDKRLVRVYDFYPSEREWEIALKGYAEDPCPSTVLVIVNGSKKQNACDLKKKKGVTFVDCARVSEETLQKWLFALMRRGGLSPDPDAVELMVRYCARNAARLKIETDKLKSILGEGGRVTRAAVEEHIERDTEYRIYELTQAASRGNFSAFSEILGDLMKKGYDENAALAALTAHYKTLSEISSMAGSDKEIAKTLGMNPYAVQKDRELAARLGADRVRRRYLELYRLSCRMRGGLYSKTGALNAAITKIFFD